VDHLLKIISFDVFSHRARKGSIANGRLWAQSLGLPAGRAPEVETNRIE